jgi:hypothetical protein
MMNAMFSKLIGAGALFLLVFLSGFWLARAGKPYSQVIFTIHKLVALAAVVILGTLIARINQFAPIQAVQWLAIAATALCLVALFVTGGLLSLDKAAPEFVIKLHQILPYLAVISIGVDIYLLAARGHLLAVR